MLSRMGDWISWVVQGLIGDQGVSRLVSSDLYSLKKKLCWKVLTCSFELDFRFGKLSLSYKCNDGIYLVGYDGDGRSFTEIDRKRYQERVYPNNHRYATLFCHCNFSANSCTCGLRAARDVKNMTSRILILAYLAARRTVGVVEWMGIGEWVAEEGYAVLDIRASIRVPSSFRAVKFF